MKNKNGLAVIGFMVFVCAWTTTNTRIRAEDAAAPKTELVVPAAVKVPQTAEDHTAMAKTYLNKAIQYRQDAKFHRGMLADYIKANASPLKTQPGEKSWVKKMRSHCEKYIKDAEALAAEADQFAQYHKMRGEELEGK